MANTTKKTSPKKTNSELALEAHQKQTGIIKSAESAKIEKQIGKTKEFVIAEGTDDEYTIVLQFPGVARALEIQDIAANRYDNIAFGLLMKEAIKDVIVSPKITSLGFWDEHAGLGDVAAHVNSFLNAGLSGQL